MQTLTANTTSAQTAELNQTLDLTIAQLNGRMLAAADAIGVALEEEREANSAWVEAERDYLHAKAIARAHAKAKLVADREDEVYLMVEREWVAAKSAAMRRETAKDALRATMAILNGLQSVARAHGEEARLAGYGDGVRREP
jgi:hypothetical protein